MICPTCRFCQDHGLPHLCVTRGGDLMQLATAGTDTQRQALWAALRAHPAQVAIVSVTEPPALRPVDPTWCDCGCELGPVLPDAKDRRP